MAIQKTKYERDDIRDAESIVGKTLGNSYWVVREVYKNLPFLRYLTCKVENLNLSTVQFQSNAELQQLEWKYENEDTWNVLVTYADLLGDSIAQALIPINAELATHEEILTAINTSITEINLLLGSHSASITEILERLDALESTGTTTSGWTPVLSLVQDGIREVLKVSDWLGGTGTKPEVDVYIGSEGYVTDIAEAENLKGAKGDKGDDGGDSLLSLPAAGSIIAYKTVTTDADGFVIYGDAGTTAHWSSILGIALNSASAGGHVAIAQQGLVTNAGWNWTVGDTLFVGLNGDITTQQVGVFSQTIGYALSATQIFLRLGRAIVRS